MESDQHGHGGPRTPIRDALRQGMASLARRLATAVAALTQRGRNGVPHSPNLNDASVAPSPPNLIGDLVREGKLVRLRTHVPANRAAFQRWYADEEIAGLLRHDQEPLNEIQSRGYFDTIILPLSARGHSYAIHRLTAIG